MLFCSLILLVWKNKYGIFTFSLFYFSYCLIHLAARTSDLAIKQFFFLYVQTKNLFSKKFLFCCKYFPNNLFII